MDGKAQTQTSLLLADNSWMDQYEAFKSQCNLDDLLISCLNVLPVCLTENVRADP